MALGPSSMVMKKRAGTAQEQRFVARNDQADFEKHRQGEPQAVKPRTEVRGGPGHANLKVERRQGAMEAGGFGGTRARAGKFVIRGSLPANCRSSRPLQGGQGRLPSASRGWLPSVPARCYMLAHRPALPAGAARS